MDLYFSFDGPGLVGEKRPRTYGGQGREKSQRNVDLMTFQVDKRIKITWERDVRSTKIVQLDGEISTLKGRNFLRQ